MNTVELVLILLAASVVLAIAAQRIKLPYPIVLVLGGIYGGLFTPTEAGAAGAFGAMVIALLKRRLDWPKLWEVIGDAGDPPKDQAKLFAVVASLLLLAIWIVVPGIIGFQVIRQAL